MADHLEATGEDVTWIGDSAEAVRTSAVVFHSPGGREFPMYSSSGCKTCNSHHRLAIEEMLLKSMGYRAIVDLLPPGHGLTPRNLKDHLKNGHSAASTALSRAIYEKHLGESADDATDSIISGLGFLHNVVRLGGEGIDAGTIKVNIKEAVNAATTLVVLDQMAGATKDDLAGARKVMQVMVDLAQKYLTEDDFQAYMNDLRDHPDFIASREAYEERRALSAG